VLFLSANSGSWKVITIEVSIVLDAIAEAKTPTKRYRHARAGKLVRTRIKLSKIVSRWEGKRLLPQTRCGRDAGRRLGSLPGADPNSICHTAEAVPGGQPSKVLDLGKELPRWRRMDTIEYVLDRLPRVNSTESATMVSEPQWPVTVRDVLRAWRQPHPDCYWTNGLGGFKVFPLKSLVHLIPWLWRCRTIKTAIYAKTMARLGIWTMTAAFGTSRSLPAKISSCVWRSLSTSMLRLAKGWTVGCKLRSETAISHSSRCENGLCNRTSQDGPWRRCDGILGSTDVSTSLVSKWVVWTIMSPCRSPCVGLSLLLSKYVC